jgi:DNA uptake protein ComE-like DNA-binding protein
MAPRHWLDPLARQLLIATGQLPRPERAAPRSAQEAGPVGSEAAALLQGWWQSGKVAAAATASDPLAADKEQQEAIERDLLALQLAQQPGRRLTSAKEVERLAALGWRLDVNRATAADWLRLPGCSPDQADLLQRLQSGGVQLSGPEDLQRLLQLDPQQLSSWLPLLEFRWYGTPPVPVPAPVAVNGASAEQLRRLEGLSEAELTRLLQERTRQPFRDLADLQQRLALPAAVIESWIGRVSFDPPPPGPRLPRSARPSGR